ncbi:WxL domain-containing protein [Enterococcus faecalis]|uniref:WxL domain-containing protein n=1 Tax=Enterococcus faecalis TaxID=1351 RepID=UPI000425C911|nr:WxL domain-containing protein [Enterococcus faecalis]
MKKSISFLGATLLASTTFLGAGSAFAQTSVDETTPNPSQAQTPITAVLEINQTPEKSEVPKGEEGGGDKPTDIAGVYGIAYVPNTLSGRATLNESGEQQVDLANNSATKYNVGVQDKTRKNDQQWTLKAQLSWTGDTNGYMKGTKITATGGNVKENKAGILSDLSEGQVTTTASTLTIEQNSEVEVMKAATGKTMNGVYNYQFTSPKLVIPEVSTVAAGTYNGNINWNLENTPTV